jgi:cytochrome c oxidase subunit 2
MAPYDVVHSFYVPGLRVKQDATPGMVTTFWFKAVKEGVYEIACSALCGIGHYTMKGYLTVESKDAFEKWLADLSAEASQAAGGGDFWDEAPEESTSTSTTKIPTKWGWAWQGKN